MANREWLSLREAAIAKAYGKKDFSYGEPLAPSKQDVLYLNAIAAFSQGQQCKGWDLVEEAEALG